MGDEWWGSLIGGDVLNCCEASHFVFEWKCMDFFCRIHDAANWWESFRGNHFLDFFMNMMEKILKIFWLENWVISTKVEWKNNVLLGNAVSRCVQWLMVPLFTNSKHIRVKGLSINWSLTLHSNLSYCSRKVGHKLRMIHSCLVLQNSHLSMSTMYDNSARVLNQHPLTSPHTLSLLWRCSQRRLFTFSLSTNFTFVQNIFLFCWDSIWIFS